MCSIPRLRLNRGWNNDKILLGQYLTHVLTFHSLKVMDWSGAYGR